MSDLHPIGIVRGKVLYASGSLLAQRGVKEVRRQFGIERRFPVQTDLGGHVVMVEADSHEEAVQRYFGGVTP